MTSPEKPGTGDHAHTPVEGSGGAAGVVNRHHDIFWAAVEATRMPMVVSDPRQEDCPIVFANPAFVEMVGYPIEEIVGRNCRFLQGPGTDRKAVAEIKQAIVARRPFSVEIQNHRKDGTPFWNALFVTPIFDPSGEVLYFYGSQLDVTRRRELEEAAFQSQKMEAIGQLTGGIAHDFNNSLQVISGFTDAVHAMAERAATGGHVDPVRLTRAAMAIRTSVDRAAALTQQLLAFSRRQRLEGRSVNLNVLVEGMEDMIERAVGVVVLIDLQLAPDLWNCRIDPGQAETALLNVMLNARDAMLQGGQLVVRTTNVMVDDPGEAARRGLGVGPHVSVAVTDTGIGMTAEVLQHAMEPFFTTKAEGKGTGLGLAMVHGFVKQSGGTVEIVSRPDVGTTVQILFPATEEAAAATAQLVEAGSGTGTETVLVVDDRPDVADTAAMILEGLGYRVLSADGPDEAMRIAGGPEPIALLFTDLIMPGGMDGVQLARAVRELRPGIRVLLTTGYAEASMERTDVGGHELETIMKPWRRQDLAARVRAVLDGAGES